MKTIIYPKILILGQPFNRFSGGGITLTNLFKDWPMDKMAVISFPFMLNNCSFDSCNTNYQLGECEYHWRFPFNLYKQTFQSGIIDKSGTQTTKVNQNKAGIRQFLSEKFINPFFEWLGLTHCQSDIKISEKLQDWLSFFNPDVLYIQVSNREGILFASRLIEYLRIPSVIHMMDDWPSTISEKGLFRNFWKNKILHEFKLLLNKIDLHLSISDAMSVEYRIRYGHEFAAFHNTLDLKIWMPNKKLDLNLDKNGKTILFSGRIGTGINKSLFEVASATEILNQKDNSVKLHIQSPNIDKKTLNLLKKYKSVVINHPIEYSSIPKLYSKADILVIANDFSKKGIRYLKFSMPTKAPEYMISGTPVLVYASSETALYKLFEGNKLGHCVSMRSVHDLTDAINKLLSNIQYREELSNTAVNYAIEHFDSDKVRTKFQQLLVDLSKRNN
jgi:glycosyltransferase involved in cell wall biosynthesis